MRSLAVMAGGAVGTAGRWWVARLLPATPAGFPWATLTVNVTGAFALALLGTMLIERSAVDPRWRSFLGIGLLGSYTTFSTMAMEGIRLIEVGKPTTAIGYWVATLLLGQMAAVYGLWIGRLESLWRR